MNAKYPIPLYLNQKYVFDLLAMMEGGLSQVETVRTSDARVEEAGRTVGGEVGVKNVFALLGVSLSGSSDKRDRADVAAEVTRERVHTPNSLFARLRERLWDEGEVQRLEDFDSLQPGTFVEFEAGLRKNPLIDAIEGVRSIARVAFIFSDEGVSHGGKGSQKGKSSSSKPSQSKAQLAQIESLLNELSREGAIDVIGEISDRDVKAVLTIDPAFLADPSMSDLLDAEYTVFGKVTKILTNGSDQSINLLRKTSLGKVHGRLLQQMMTGFADAEAYGLSLPEMVTEIEGPAIQILPISIFS